MPRGCRGFRGACAGSQQRSEVSLKLAPATAPITFLVARDRRHTGADYCGSEDVKKQVDPYEWRTALRAWRTISICYEGLRPRSATRAAEHGAIRRLRLIERRVVSSCLGRPE